MNGKNMYCGYAAALLLFLCSGAGAQSSGFQFGSSRKTDAPVQVSAQSHTDKVSAILPLENPKNADSSFFTAGNDGFLVRWAASGQGAHYQIGTLSIPFISQHPKGNDIAVCETDGVAVNRISVLSWKDFSRLHTERFKDNISCLAYSEQGNYLLVGTAAVGGMYILNAKNGTIIRNITEIPSIITMARTGASEKTAVMYSPSGYLYYYDLKKNKVIAKFQTTASLEQPVLFGTGKLSNRFFAGVKGNTIYVIDATNGKCIAQYAATAPLIFAGRTEAEEGLYFISSMGKNFALQLIGNEALAPYLKSSPAGLQPESTKLKTFAGLKSGDSFTAAAKNSESVFLGTQHGTIYKMSDIAESENYSLAPLSEKIFDRVYDLGAEGSDFYLLTDAALYKADFASKLTQKVAPNQSQTNFIKDGESVILWSKGTKKAVQRIALTGNPEGAFAEVLFTPQNRLQNVRLAGSKLLYVQGNSTVSQYDLNTGKTSVLYTGTAVEDAILDGDAIYVAKTSMGGTDAPLVSVNLKTGETAPVKINGYVAYSLSSTGEAGSGIYGIAMRSQNAGAAVTEVFAYSPENKSVRTLLKLSDEDAGAATVLAYPVLYTNLGKNQIYACNVQNGRNTSYRRSSALPGKTAAGDRHIISLNSDGSISWYEKNNPQAVANWCFTTSGEWQEF